MGGEYPVRIRILGPLEVRRADQWHRISAAKQRVLLAVLAVNPGRPISVDRLTAELWPDGPPRTAVNQIHGYVARLRKALGDSSSALLITRSPGYELAAGPEDIDAGVFERLLDQGRAALRTGEAERAETLLTRALELWRGPALEGVPATPDLRAEIDRLTELRLAAWEARLDARLDQGRHDDVIVEVPRLVGEHPYRERFWAQLMLALYRAGRRDDALQTYQRVRRLFDDELGLEPGPELQNLEQAILTRDPSLNLDRRGSTKVPPAQLPADIASFAGRSEQLRMLQDRLTVDGERPATVVITAIEGTAGVGKTTLAIHWAHQVADHFPDGQLYVNLRGFDPDGSVMSPGEAIRGFLDALHVPPERIPASLDAQAALYRSLLADRRMLVVLDNARDSDQVRPLLPGSPGCLVVVTSRNQLSGLVATEGAHAVVLDLLPEDEAYELLRRRLGADRIQAEPEAVKEIVNRCARLPLALAIVAARAAAHPGFSLGALAAELRKAGAGLDALDAGDPATDVRTVFSWSYHTLKPEAARLFRLLGLHPGPDITPPAAASLIGVPLAEVRPLLAALTRGHLLSEPVPSRYRLHDLLRVYATELANAFDAETTQRAATRRLLDHYLYTAHTATGLLNPMRFRISLDEPPPGVFPEKLEDHVQAMRWFTEEHAVLVAAVEFAAANGFDGHAWRLAGVLGEFLIRRGHWHDQVRVQRLAIEAAKREGDLSGQAFAERGLGRAYAKLGRNDDAHTHYQHAIDLYIRLGDRKAQAGAHLGYAGVSERQGRHREALHHSRLALELQYATGDKTGQAIALNMVGWYHAQLGDYERALAFCRQSLALQQQLGDRFGQADTWDSLGFAHHHLKQYRQAAQCYRRAVALYREAGDRHGEADVLSHYGDTLYASGEKTAARDTWQQALTILLELGHPDAGLLRAKLREHKA